MSLFHHSLILRSLTLAFLVFAGSVSTAHALTTYTYTGNPYAGPGTNGSSGLPFPVIVDTPNIAGAYNDTQFVQGFFDVPITLSAGLVNADISASITAFSFTDGRQTFDETSTLSRKLFKVTTGATGQIVSWQIILQQRNVVHTLDAIETINLGATKRDRGLQQISAGSYDLGSITNNPGAWTVTPVPEPGTALLLSLGLVGLATRRRDAR